jgi:LL-diaminopimelate aminotransferase
MKFRPALRLEQLPPYVFTSINQRKRELISAGKDLIDLGMGDPDLETPPAIVERLVEAVRQVENQKYPPYGGLPEFRKSAAGWMEKRFNVKVDPDTEVASLIGSKEGVVHFTQSFVNPGDFCLLPDPGYPSYMNAVLLSGGTPLTYALTWANRFRPDWSMVEESVWKSLRLVYINYPHNPTSATVEIDTYRDLVEKAQRYGFIILSDGAYCEHGFETLPPCLMQVPGAKEVAVEMFTCSKTYNMTGFRVGFAVGQKGLIETFLIMKSCVDTGVFKAVQWAAIAAFDGDEKELVEPSRDVFRYRRAFMRDELQKRGYEVFDGQATYYLWIKVPRGYSSTDWAWKAMDEGVVVTPGSGFGKNGEGYFRIALTVPEERLRSAIERFPKV